MHQRMWASNSANCLKWESSYCNFLEVKSFAFFRMTHIWEVLLNHYSLKNSKPPNSKPPTFFTTLENSWRTVRETIFRANLFRIFPLTIVNKPWNKIMHFLVSSHNLLISVPMTSFSQQQFNFFWSIKVKSIKTIKTERSTHQ